MGKDWDNFGRGLCKTTFCMNFSLHRFPQCCSIKKIESELERETGIGMKNVAGVVCGILTMLAWFPVCSAEVYRSDSDTGTNILDYIEINRRWERENRLNEEQTKLVHDALAMKDRLQKQTLDPAQHMPVAFEGDDLTYDERTGEFTAVGHVDIIQMDGRRFQGEKVTGNIQEHVIRVPDKTHVLQLPPGETRVTLDGYRAIYNYADKTGSLEDVTGKAGAHYVTGKRFEFYPDRVVIYEGTQTKCGAKNPDYHVSAEKIEIWPNDVMKMYRAKFWLGKTVVATRDYYESDLTKKEDNVYPKMGYNSTYGAYVEQDFKYPLADHVTGTLHAHLESKKGIRSNADVFYGNRNFSARAVYGFYSDSNEVWIQKEPGLILDYGRRIGTLPLSYNLKYEIGHWRSSNANSTHQYYEAGITRDPIVFHRWTLHLHAGYTVTKESANDSSVRGMNYDAVLARDFDPKWAAYTGYHYSKSNTQNSVFSYGLDNYSKKFEAGLSYRMDNLNRFVAGINIDVGTGHLADVDYFWYHDLHCSQLILRYRAKRDQYSVHWQFTPW